MNTPTDNPPVLSELQGVRSELCLYEWPTPGARYVAVIAHGACEHLGRYGHVAAALQRHGGAVSGADHMGHGRSGGERMKIAEFADTVTDLDSVVTRASVNAPGLPVVLIGHSMGGMIATRFAQTHPGRVAALVLSGPLLGPWPVAPMLLAMDPMPDFPIDPGVLSRDLEACRAYAEDPLVWHGGLPRVSLEAAVRCLASVDAGPGLGALPTLWLHGAEDPLVGKDVARQGLERIRGTAFESRVYPGARHEIFNETNKDEVLRDLTEFIDRARGWLR